MEDHILLSQVKLPAPLPKPVKPPQNVMSANTLDTMDYSVVRKFEGKQPLPGLENNVVVVLKDKFIGRGQTKEASHEPESVRGTENEAKNLAMEVGVYLIRNGITSVKVLSNYGWYVREINPELKNLCPQIASAGGGGDSQSDVPTDVTLVLLFSVYGSLQQKKMLYIMHEAFRTSKMGVVILGNEDITQFSGRELLPAWGQMVDYLRGKVGWKNYLQIVCRHHKVGSKVQTSKCLQERSPFGGCNKYCGYLPCGHYCSQPCHPLDRKHQTKYRCKEPCRRVCPRGHRCEIECWRRCLDCMFVATEYAKCGHSKVAVRQDFCDRLVERRCTVQVPKKLPCEHFAMLECSSDETTSICQELLEKELDCGHVVQFACSESENVGNPACPMKIVKTCGCGHQREIMCAERHQYENVPCDQKCTEVLKCGHVCGMPCHQEPVDHEEVLCMTPCDRYCKRGVHECVRWGQHPCHEDCRPCQQNWDANMGCGHTIRIICCEERPADEDFICQENCFKVLHCRHTCTRKCSEDCYPCEKPVPKTVQGCPRGHTRVVKCNDPAPQGCTQMIPALPQSAPDCGHTVLVPCSKADRLDKKTVTARCEVPCQAMFDQESECGHQCRGSCGECFQGKFHERCTNPCGKMLFCGHACEDPCGAACPPCFQPCFNYCEHQKCEMECGVPCEPVCQEPCPYKCPHSKCSKRCSEVCDKQRCEEPCPKILSCGHRCVGFCGEECPPFCGVCQADLLLAGVFDGSTDLEPTHRFIYLPDCGHAVESTGLDGWLHAKVDEILPLRCPLCRKRIPWMRRYSALFMDNFKLINDVREKIFGSRKEVVGLLRQVDRKFMKAVAIEDVEETYRKVLLRIPEWIYVGNENGAAGGGEPADNEFTRCIDISSVRFLNWLLDDYLAVMNALQRLSEFLQEEKLSWVVDLWTTYFVDMIGKRDWPLHQNEMRQLRLERDKIGDIIQLYSRLDRHEEDRQWPSLTDHPQGERLVEQAEDLLLSPGAYTVDRRERFMNILMDINSILNFTLDLTAQERAEIVSAFGDRSGRWFKCPNGHIYVVTECGGVMEEGNCNECGAAIGGAQHRLRSDNWLASEMDGARAPIYPTVLDPGPE